MFLRAQKYWMFIAFGKGYLSFDRSNCFLIGGSANSAQTFKKCYDQPAVMEPLSSENSKGKDHETKVKYISPASSGTNFLFISCLHNLSNQNQ